MSVRFISINTVLGIVAFSVSLETLPFTLLPKRLVNTDLDNHHGLDFRELQASQKLTEEISFILITSWGKKYCTTPIVGRKWSIILQLNRFFILFTNFVENLSTYLRICVLLTMCSESHDNIWGFLNYGGCSSYPVKNSGKNKNQVYLHLLIFFFKWNNSHSIINGCLFVLVWLPDYTDEGKILKLEAFGLLRRIFFNFH